MTDQLLTAQELADLLSLNQATIWRQVSAGGFPRPLYVAIRRPRWRRSEVEAWLEARRMAPSEAYEQRRAARLRRATAE